MSKSRKRPPAKPADTVTDERIAAVKARLIDIARGVCGANLGDLDTVLDCNCIVDSSQVGNWLAAVFGAFNVPAVDLARQLNMVQHLIDFDTAARFLAERQLVWASQEGQE